jgi:hypothetical protein
MAKVGVGPIATLIVGAVLCVAMTAGRAAAERTEFPARFAARAVSGPEDAGPIDIYVERWSTDGERDELLGALDAGRRGELLTVLERQRRRAGVLLMPGVQAHGERTRTRTPKNLKYAREIVTPAGRQVILASDQHLGLGESRLEARKEVYEFSLMDIRFGPDGTGIGKVAAAGDVVYNAKTKTLELKDYDTKPARIVNVRSAIP